MPFVIFHDSRNVSGFLTLTEYELHRLEPARFKYQRRLSKATSFATESDARQFIEDSVHPTIETIKNFCVMKVSYLVHPDWKTAEIYPSQQRGGTQTSTDCPSCS
jgi:hypothetical protein